MSILVDYGYAQDIAAAGAVPTTMQRGAARTQATRWMRTHLGRAGNRWANWGLSGMRGALTRNWQNEFGFFQTEQGYKFLGGKAGRQGIKTLGIGVGVGAAVYAATDNPLLGLGAGLGASWAAGGIKKAWGGASKLFGPLFVAGGMVGGYQEGGVGGAVWGGAKAFAEMRLWNVGMEAASVAFKGTSIGSTFSALGSFAKTVAPPLAVAAGIGYGIYKGAQYFAARGREATQSEFAGDMAAFETQAAYTMRQRALQEISRSHTNSRTILGNEAQLMHLR